MPTNPIPDGQHAATPYLCCRNAAGALGFYERGFGAVETMRLVGPDGRIGHAEITIGAARVMLSDEHPEEGVVSPAHLGGSPVTIHLYVEDVDALTARAAAAGARIVRQPTDQFYGDRVAVVVDPAGHVWMLASRREDLSLDEVIRRAGPYTAGPPREG